MKSLELRMSYQLQQIIKVISEKNRENGFTNTDTDFCIYAKEDILKPELICYLDLSPTISDDDEEVYPSFIRKNDLVLLYSGQQFEDVLMDVSNQKNDAAIADYILALDYYLKYDTFRDFR